MSEVAEEQRTESEENSEESSSVEGSSAPAEASGSESSESDSAEARIRYWQSEADKAKSRQSSLEARLKELEERQTESSAVPDGGQSNLVDPVQFLEQIELRTEMREARKQLSEQYPFARSEVINGFARYRSVDDYVFAVEQDHRNYERKIQPEIDRKVQAARVELEAKFGGMVSPPDANGAAIPGEPTAEQLANMSMREWDELEGKFPGILDRVLRNTPQ